MSPRLAIAILLIVSCRDSTPSTQEKTNTAPTPPLSVTAAWIDRAHTPRRDGALVVGEPVLVGYQQTSGAAPYRVAVAFVASDASITTAAQTTVEKHVIKTASVALQTEIPKSLNTGRYRVRLQVTDASGKSSAADSAEFRIIGNDERLLTADSGASTFAEVLDVGGRRRAYFVRGEPVWLRVKFPNIVDGASARLFHESKALVLAEKVSRRADSYDLATHIPRLARNGRYFLEFKPAAGPPMRTGFEVRDVKLKPTSTLAIQDLRVYGGPSLREPRAAELSPGEKYLIEAAVGGAAKSLSTTVLVRHGTKMVLEESWQQTVQADATNGFAISSGTITIPKDFPSGRYVLDIQVRESEHVSALHREVGIR